MCCCSDNAVVTTCKRMGVFDPRRLGGCSDIGALFVVSQQTPPVLYRRLREGALSPEELKLS